MLVHLVPPVALDSEVTQFLDHVALAPRQTHALLTLWPIVASGGGAVSRPYVALRDAMARGVLVVDELDTGALAESKSGADADYTATRRHDLDEISAAFHAALRKTRSESRLSLGLGGDLRLESADICGSALVAPELVHLTAFPAIA